MSHLNPPIPSPVATPQEFAKGSKGSKGSWDIKYLDDDTRCNETKTMHQLDVYPGMSIYHDHGP